MGIAEQLLEDMKSAMKAGESERVSIIRMARAALQEARIAKRRELSEEEAVEVLAREAKKCREAAEEYRRLGQQERAVAEEAEARALAAYLPQQLSDAEIEEVVRAAIEELGAQSTRELGKVMGVVMSKLRGRADGKTVNQIARSLLGE